MMNPFLANRKSTYIYLLVWALIIGAHAKILFVFYGLDFTLALADGLTFNLLFAGLALGFWYSVRYLNIDKQSTFYLLLNHIGAAVIFLGIWLAAGFFILEIVGERNQAYITFLDNSAPWRFFNGVLYYSIIVLIYYLYIYYNSFKEKLTKESALRALVKETELSLLKSQLNPHFIFNSLNSISSLTITDPSRAQEMVVRLSSFLRYALEQNTNKLIPLAEELENCMLYLEIEKTRFGNKLLFEKQIPEEGKVVPVPNMILQPLLENAIKYGVCESTEPVTISIQCEKENPNYFRICISNTFDSGSTVKKGQGIGIRNVKERLYLVFGKKDLIKISDTHNLFTVNLYIPITD
jgi:two-component system, LytTR family, sensor kinase